jgi:uncharacterized paraquat-inducible protein A
MTSPPIMIITIQDAMLLQVLGLLALAFIAYISSIVRDRATAWEPSRHKLSACSKCGLVFVVKRQAQLPQCPRCSGRSEPYLSKKHRRASAKR